MCVVFDFDGVLVDTRPVVEQAYRDVGVEMPTDAWGLPWYEWLGDAEKHERKTHAYVKLIDRGELDSLLLPGHRVLWQVMLDGRDVFILTGASLAVVMAYTRRYFPSMRPEVLDGSASMAQKTVKLQQLATSGQWSEVVYVDDDNVLGRRVVEWTRNEHVRFVHYDHPWMTQEMLYQEVTRGRGDPSGG